VPSTCPVEIVNRLWGHGQRWAECQLWAEYQAWCAVATPGPDRQRTVLPAVDAQQAEAGAPGLAAVSTWCALTDRPMVPPAACKERPATAALEDRSCSRQQQQTAQQLQAQLQAMQGHLLRCLLPAAANPPASSAQLHFCSYTPASQVPAACCRSRSTHARSAPESARVIVPKGRRCTSCDFTCELSSPGGTAS